MLTYYCPNCWATIQNDTVSCPKCGFALADYDHWVFKEKLLHALNHPVPEMRATAIETLAKLNDGKCLKLIDQIIWDSHEDYYVASAAIRALAEIKNPLAKRLLQRVTKHPSRLLSQEAKRMLKKNRV